MFAKPASFKPYAAIKNSERKQILAKIEKQCGLEGEDSALRQQLLPKTVQAAKAITHGGEKITVYADSQLPLWIVTRNGLVPTVAALLNLPDDFQLRLLPTVYTVGRTLQFLQNGADFMVPGIFGELPKVGKDTVVALRDLETNALLATGVSLVDLGNLDPEKDKGKCVLTVSVVADKLTPNTTVKPLTKSGAEAVNEAEKLEEQLTDEKPTDEQKADEDEVVKVAEMVEEQSLEDEIAEPEEVLSPKEIDEAFVYAANVVIRQPRTYPISMSSFAALLNDHLPFQHSQLLVKNTTFKKMNKLIKHVENLGLLSSRERQGGEVIITGAKVAVGDASLTPVPPTRKRQVKKDRMQVDIRYKPHPNVRLVAPQLTGDLVDAATLKKVTFDYIFSHNLAKPGDTEVLLDTELRKALGQRQTVTSVSRDDVGTLVVKSSTPFHRIVPIGTKPEDAKWTKGGVPSIQIKTERRGGNKTVTLVGQAGLQGFGIDPSQFADELRHACAGSAALTDTKGFAAITVQGNHVAKIQQVLEKKGVRPAYIK